MSCAFCEMEMVLCIRRRLNGLTVSHKFEHVSQNRLYVMRMMKMKDAQHKTSGEIEVER